MIDKTNIARSIVTDFCEDDSIEKGIRDEEKGKEEETTNSLQKYQQTASESLAVNNNIREIAPGEGYSTKRLLYDENCEKLPFPQHFSKGRFRYESGTSN